jgi:hypothetical protein
MFSIKALSRLYQGSIKALSRLYQGSIKALSRLYQGSIKALSRLYQGSIKALSRLYQGSIKVLWMRRFRLYVGRRSRTLVSAMTCLSSVETGGLSSFLYTTNSTSATRCNSIYSNGKNLVMNGREASCKTLVRRFSIKFGNISMPPRDSILRGTLCKIGACTRRCRR